MFIYKITNTENNKSYIGFDSHAEHLSHRWNEHIRDCTKIDTKFYIAFRQGMDMFEYTIIDRAERILDLALKEIYWIDFYDSYKNGYNSTKGGDGMNYDLSQYTEEEIQQLKRVYSLAMTEYNNNEKWKDTTVDDRKDLTSHLHTETVYNKKSKSLEKYWDTVNETIRNDQLRGLKIKWKELPEEVYKERKKQNRLNSALGAAKVSKKVKIELPDGSTKIFNSKSEFVREHGEIINAILRKTKENKSHRGFKGWEI